MGSSVPIILTSFLIILLKSDAATPEKLLNDICANSTNPSFCFQTFRSDPRTSSAKDALSLAKIALDLAVKNSGKTHDDIQALSTSNATEAAFKPALKQCVESYNAVTASFRSANAEVEEGEYETANYDSKVAADGAVECEEALAKVKARIQSVSDKIQVTKYFSNIADRVTSILWSSHSAKSNP